MFIADELITGIDALSWMTNLCQSNENYRVLAEEVIGFYGADFQLCIDSSASLSSFYAYTAYKRNFLLC